MKRVDIQEDYWPNPKGEYRGIIPEGLRKLRSWWQERRAAKLGSKVLNEIKTKTPQTQPQADTEKTLELRKPQLPELEAMRDEQAQRAMREVTTELPQIQPKEPQTGGHITSDTELMEVRRAFRPLPNADKHTPKHAAPEQEKLDSIK